MRGARYKEMYKDLNSKHEELLGLLSRLHPGIDVGKLQQLNIIDEGAQSEVVPEPSSDDMEASASEAYIRSKDAHGHDPRVLGSASVFKLKSVEKIREMAVGYTSNFNIHQRSQYWSSLSWKTEDDNFDPPQDLIDNLVEIYFNNTGLHRPLLHKKTFKEGKMFDKDFRRCLWLVCAIGSRLSDDPRVLDPSELGPNGKALSFHSAGWPFFLKYASIAKTIPALSPSLADLQQSALAAVFLHSNPYHSSSWTIAAQGVVLSKDIGAHFHRSSGDVVKDELRRRAFWNLYQIDSEMSTFLGRDSTIAEHLIKIPRPAALPDENEQDIVAFNAFLDLIVIARHALDSLYDDRSISLAPSDPMKAHQLILNVAELNNKLDNWVMNIPDFLKWSDDNNDSKIFTQRSTLMSLYLMVQTLVHRPFINATGHLRSLSLTSSAICVNAALSMAHVVDLFKEIDPRTDTIVTYAFISCVSALVCKWTGKMKGTVIFDDLEKAVEMLHNYIKSRESRYYVAGRLSDIITWLRDDNNGLDITIEKLFNSDIENMLTTTIPSAQFLNTLPSLTSLDDNYPFDY